MERGSGRAAGWGGCSLDNPLLGFEGSQGVQAQPIHHLEEGPVTWSPLDGEAPLLPPQGPLAAPAHQQPARQGPAQRRGPHDLWTVTRSPGPAAGKRPGQLPPGTRFQLPGSQSRSGS